MIRVRGSEGTARVEYGPHDRVADVKSKVHCHARHRRRRVAVVSSFFSPVFWRLFGSCATAAGAPPPEVCADCAVGAWLCPAAQCVWSAASLTRLAQLAAEWKVPANTIALSRDMGKKQLLADADLVARLGLAQGDLLFASFSVAPVREVAVVEQVGLPDVKEDEVDRLLDAQDGWVKQKRDERTCFRHAVNGSCVHCMPVPPWAILTIEPWKSEGVKLIPFTSWLRHRDQGRGECRHTKQPGVFCQNCRPLTEDVYTAKKCDRHEPWPKGVCSYCKPDTIRIQRQEYRHVDHVVFENKEVIGALIGAFMQNGCQRGGEWWCCCWCCRAVL